jgi:hypothetical protein
MSFAFIAFLIIAFGLIAMFNLDSGRELESRPTLRRLPRPPRAMSPTVDVDGVCTRLESIPSVADHDAHVVDGLELNTRERGWMQTYGGRKFYPLDPRVRDVELVDVAHGLAMTCRYGGQCRMFYSVAEHCVLVSEIVEMHARNAGMSAEQVRLIAQCALMHDSAEAYIGDMIRPLKHQPEMVPFRHAEDVIEAVIAEAFKLHWTPEAHSIVKRIDDRILVDEITYLMPHPGMYLESPLLRDQSPLGARFHCYAPADAERAFLARYRELFS